MGKTLVKKLLGLHTIRLIECGTALLHIKKRPGHEVTSSIAFDRMRLKGRKPVHPELCFFVCDHNTSTTGGWETITDPHSRLQLETLEKNCAEFGITCYGVSHPKNGIIHRVVIEEGIVLPGDSAACGDSHTSTYGAIGALAFGIGTTEVQTLLETSCIEQAIPKTMRITIDGELNKDVTPKDVVLYIIGKIGASGGAGYAVELAGSTFRNMPVSGRITSCNMMIEGGAKIAIIGVDDKTIEYCKNTPGFKKSKYQGQRISFWKTLHSDSDAVFDKEYFFHATDIFPQVTWGISPDQVVDVNGSIPPINESLSVVEKKNLGDSLSYMGLSEGTKMSEVEVQYIFIGSCTNGGIEDLRKAAEEVRGKKIAPNIETAWVIPATMEIKRQAEKEGLDTIFVNAGFKWGKPSCSACLAMNDDRVPECKRCASTSNRPFKGRQGPGARTHLVSPITAAKTAIAGYFCA